MYVPYLVGFRGAYRLVSFGFKNFHRERLLPQAKAKAAPLSLSSRSFHVTINLPCSSSLAHSCVIHSPAPVFKHASHHLHGLMVGSFD